MSPDTAKPYRQIYLPFPVALLLESHFLNNISNSTHLLVAQAESVR